jgi:DNA invertase Pin-like site-specific DNA recombinase
VDPLGSSDVEGVRAAQYLRMSAEHQNYSLSHQHAAIAAYAAAHHLDVVRTYTDAGISGLTLAKRDGLKQLLAEVLGGKADYAVVLVYDVSRWGRFQDADESAHYEFLCRQAGVRVEYCAELFDNDGSLASTLLKQIKRSMAGEFSRDLSAKVVLAQRRLAQMGYWQGGPPGYGLRRQIQNAHGERGNTLEDGEQKALRGTRVVLVHGPPAEIAVVRRIFRLFLVDGLSRPSIARRLNAECVPSSGGAAWTPFKIRHVLENEHWAGVQVYGKTICRLGARPQKMPQQAWIRTEGVLSPIVSRQAFAATRRNLDR